MCNGDSVGVTSTSHRESMNRERRKGSRFFKSLIELGVLRSGRI